MLNKSHLTLNDDHIIIILSSYRLYRSVTASYRLYRSVISCHVVHVSVLTCECAPGSIYPPFAKDTIRTQLHGHHRPQYTHGESCVCSMPQSSPCRQDHLRQHDKLISLDAVHQTMNSLSDFMITRLACCITVLLV